MLEKSSVDQRNMKKAICLRRSLDLLVVCMAALVTTGWPIQADAEVSISIGHPGFYGRIEIGALPPPLLIYPQPIVIVPRPAPPQPIYLRVPPGHARHWAKHCHRYHACNRPVYFVEERWYHDVYVPHHHHDTGHGHGHKGHRDKEHGHKGHSRGHKKH